jgi:hypothetical protein
MQLDPYGLSTSMMLVIWFLVTVLFLVPVIWGLYIIGVRRGHRLGMEETEREITRKHALRLAEQAAREDSPSEHAVEHPVLPTREAPGVEAPKVGADMDSAEDLPNLPVGSGDQEFAGSVEEQSGPPPSEAKPAATDIYLPEEARQFLEQSTTDHEER